MLNEGPYTKQQAINMLAVLGFSVQYDVGSCGDSGIGSRLYFKRPDARLNRFGQPYNNATVSRVMGRYWISVFDSHSEQEESSVAR